MGQENEWHQRIGDKNRSSLLSAAGLLFLATLVVYSPTLLCGYIWDDNDYVYNNRNLRDASGLVDIWLSPESSPQYYPLVFTTFWLEYRLWALWPTGYHAVNVLLHAANAVVLWQVLSRLSIPGAWWAAAVFALHPVHVESVAWITERKNTLSMLFYLGAAACFLHAAFSSAASLSLGRRRCWYAVALLLFVAALLSKTVTASLPAALLLVLWWKRGRIELGDFLAVLPMFLVGVPLGLFTAWMERHRVGAVGEEWAFSIMDRVLIAGRALWFYGGKLLFPSPLIFIYPRWMIDDRDWSQYLFPAAAGGLLFGLLALRQRIGRGPFAALAFFAGTLFPALGFINVYPMRYSFVADHFQYLASVGIIAGMAAGLSTFFVKKDASRARTAMILGSGILLVLGILTWCQCWSYLDIETLWRDTIAKNPNCEMAHTNLGLELRQQGRADEALHHFRTALELAPDDAVTHNNVGLALIDLGKVLEAERYLRKAIATEARYAEAESNLAVALERQGRFEEAERQHEKAIEIDGDNCVLRFNFAVFLHQRRKESAARREYAKSLECDANYIPAHYNLALLLVEGGEASAAVVHLEHILALDPSFSAAREQLNRIHAGKGRSQ